MKAVPKHEALEQCGMLLRQLARGKYVVGLYPLYADGSVCVSGGRFDGWGGEVEVVIRPRDLKITPGKLREVLPLLNGSEDLLRLVATAVLSAKRDWCEHFISQLDTSAFLTVTKECRCQRYKMVLYEPGVEDRSWRISIIVHCAEIAAMFDEVLQQAAKEGEA